MKRVDLLIQSLRMVADVDDPLSDGILELSNTISDNRSKDERGNKGKYFLKVQDRIYLIE